MQQVSFDVLAVPAGACSLDGHTDLMTAGERRRHRRRRTHFWLRVTASPCSAVAAGDSKPLLGSPESTVWLLPSLLGDPNTLTPRCVTGD
jgi:hypothetical protein